jgi:hypothetical protein
LDERGVGAAVAAAIIIVIIILAVGATYLAKHRGGVSYPQMAMSVSGGQAGNEIWVYVISLSSIPSGDWAYSVSATKGSYNWVSGATTLIAPSVSLGTYAVGTWYVSIKHVPSGHVYISQAPVTISGG